MKKSMRALLLAAILGMAGIGLAGCDEGRFEDAGEDIDDALD
jgi:hypothetical protein